MTLLRNLPVQQPEQLAQLIAIEPNRVISMSMSKSPHCQMTLFALGDGESVSEECYFGDTLYYVLEGRLSVSMEQDKHTLVPGDCLAIPAQTAHAIAAPDGCKLLQITLS